MTDLKNATVCEIIRELINRKEVSKLSIDCKEKVGVNQNINHKIRM
jgi:hypothetical protein